MEHTWYIDENHVVYWDNQPYIRYTFTGSPPLGSLEQFFGLGIDQFGAGASETLYVFSHDPVEHQQDRDNVEAFTTAVTGMGGTYYVGLNTLLPWKTSGKITDTSRVRFVERGMIDVSERV